MHEPSLFPAADDACVSEDTQMMRDVDHRNGQSLGEFGDTAFSSLQFTDNPQPFRCCKSGEHAGTTGGLQWIGSHGSCQTFNQTDLPPLNGTTSREIIWSWCKPREATNATRKEGTG